MADPDVARELTLVDLMERSGKARVRTLLGSKRGRAKFLGTLSRHPPFDARYVTVLPYDLGFPGPLHEELKARGAPNECYVISKWNKQHDGMTMGLWDAVDMFHWGEGTILLCIPGQLAYFVGDAVIGGGYQRIVQRPPRIPRTVGRQ